MRGSDIHRHITTNSVEGLRDAFAALRFIGSNCVLDDAGNPLDRDGRQRLLEAVCEILIEDDGAIPLDLCGELRLPEGSTYADGVAIESLERPGWHARDLHGAPMDSATWLYGPVSD